MTWFVSFMFYIIFLYPLYLYFAQFSYKIRIMIRAQIVMDWSKVTISGIYFLTEGSNMQVTRGLLIVKLERAWPFGRGAQCGGDDENEGEDTMVPGGNISHQPSQQQLDKIQSENNQFGQYRTILVDGENCSYLIHRRNHGNVQQWSRCVSQRNINCHATACFDVANNKIAKLSTAHNHSPPLFTQFLRYE